MLLEIAPFSLDTLLLEVASAFATVGLSTGMPRRGCRARAMAALWEASSHVPSHGSNRVTKASGTSQDGLYKTD